jgi:hypothetical protein
MSLDPFEFRARDLPEDIPPREQIVQLCAEAGFCRNGICFPSTGAPRFWIKYGSYHTLTLGEALTQQDVAQVVNAEAGASQRSTSSSLTKAAAISSCNTSPGPR